MRELIQINRVAVRAGEAIDGVSFGILDLNECFSQPRAMDI